MTLQLEPRHLEIIRQALRNFNKDVFAFGSRAKGTAKEFSDLDLVIMSRPDDQHLSVAKETLENSNIPFKIDIVLWERMDDTFRNHIKADLVPLFW